jgi:hypothetical protein
MFEFLIVLMLALDTLHAYVRLVVRMAYDATGSMQSLNAALPSAFRGNGMVEVIFIAWLLCGVAVLGYGIYLLGVVQGLLWRVGLWIAGRVLSKLLLTARINAQEG